MIILNHFLDQYRQCSWNVSTDGYQNKAYESMCYALNLSGQSSVDHTNICSGIKETFVNSPFEW